MIARLAKIKRNYCWATIKNFGQNKEYLFGKLSALCPTYHEILCVRMRSQHVMKSKRSAQ